MNKAEQHNSCIGLYENQRQPSNILANTCQFKMLRRTNSAHRHQKIPPSGASHFNRGSNGSLASRFRHNRSTDFFQQYEA